MERKAELAWLENPEVFRVNRLDAHSDHAYYEAEENKEKGTDTLRQSLNGVWKFLWSKNPAERPAEFYLEEEAPADFGEITVPGHIELQGYGQIQYINTMYPWEGHVFLRPPHIDWDDAPVGSYFKKFDLEEGLCGRRVCISFQGAECALYVWLNGHFIGYAEDSFTPSEFDLTEHIRKKGNVLCAQVYKRSSASWLEDQDFFRFSGLFRDVYLYAKPALHVEDLWAKAGLCEDYETGTLKIEAFVSGENAKEVLWELRDADGAIVRQGSMEKRAEKWHTEKMEIPGVHRWDVGAPYLYEVVLKLTDETGKVQEVACCSTGFRRFELRDKIMLLNGKRLEIHGVNRHEWNPRKGRAISEADMRADIEVLKRNNINAVRTCHYPNQSLWYRLCDEAGICVMDEMNLETHGSWQKMGACEPSWNVPGSDKKWESCVLDRAASMLERDKNHPSILWWSCGNESYAGDVLRTVSHYFHEKDDSRLVHYEGVFHNREYEDISDVESRMYAPPEDVRAYLENDPKKPFLLCEYMHDMGNSIGGMESYMKLFDEYPMYQGGFIWDYMDQALYYKRSDGREVLGYGGDFGDRPTDYSFSGNGIVFANRKEKPAMQEVRYWYGTRKERAEFAREQEKKCREAVKRIQAARAQKTEEKCRVKSAVQMRSGSSAAARMQVVHGDVTLGIRGAGFAFIFSYQEAGPVSIVYDGQECLYRVPRPTFWRASTENDKGNQFAQKSAVWMSADLFVRCVGCRVTEYTADGVQELDVKDMAGRAPAAETISKIEIEYLYRTPTVPETEVRVTYTVSVGGTIHVQAAYKGQKGLPQLPLFGMRFMLPYQETVEWEGLSGETYPDRMAGGCFGIHQSSLEIPDYLVPQECGNHMRTCWMQTGSLRVTMDEEPFAFSALPFTPQELENALHKEELPQTGRTVLGIYGKMRGVGGIDSWGADVEEAYQVSGKEDITFSFVIENSTDSK